MKFVSKFKSGLQAYPEGLQWLLKHPLYLILLLLPAVLSIGALFYGWSYLANADAWLMNHVMFPRRQEWWWNIIWVIGQWTLYLAVRILAFVAAVLFANILWAPIYEWVSCAVEKDFTGGVLEEVSFWRSFLLIGEELKKVLFILAISLVLIFIPFLNAISLVITALLLGWNFFDYPLVRRGWSVSRRVGFVWQNKWSVGGFGLWLMIPFLQIILYPFAVVGGTLICLRALQEKKLITKSIKQK